MCEMIWIIVGQVLRELATMPSDQSTWLIAVPQDGESEGVYQELETKFQQQLRAFNRKNFTQLSLPAFKVLNLQCFCDLGTNHFTNLSSIVYLLLHPRQEHLTVLSIFLKI